MHALKFKSIQINIKDKNETNRYTHLKSVQLLLLYITIIIIQLPHILF